MIRWPQRSLGAVAKLFEPLQDIDIYVEDAHDEVFYTHLFQRLAPNEVRIAKVFCAGNRDAVVAAASSHDHSRRRALFLIDGDLAWVRSEPAPDVARLFRLDAYCIENLLVHEPAIVQVLAEEVELMDSEAAEALKFARWENTITSPLVELFAAYACANSANPDVRTVSCGVGCLCSASTKRAVSELDRTKVATARDEALSQAVAVFGEAVASQRYNQFLQRAQSLPRPLDIVSGKDFVLPLLDFELQKHKCKVRRRTLRIKLAKLCDQRRFAQLSVAVRDAALGTVTLHW